MIIIIYKDPTHNPKTSAKSGGTWTTSQIQTTICSYSPQIPTWSFQQTLGRYKRHKVRDITLWSPIVSHLIKAPIHNPNQNKEKRDTNFI